jgi:hypothetical protein
MISVASDMHVLHNTCDQACAVLECARHPRGCICTAVAAQVGTGRWYFWLCCLSTVLNMRRMRYICHIEVSVVSHIRVNPEH